MSAISDIQAAGNLDDLYPVFDRNHYTAGWHKKRASLWREPKTQFQPLNWRYAEARAALARAGEWIGTDLAERRNLLMFNPVGDNDYATVNTLVTAYQMIKPNEYARAHRHTPNALRLILDAGEGLFTVVNGIKLPMIAGDVLLTPGRFWHSHYNEGPSEAYWLDFLDVPLVHLLEPMFYDEFEGGFQPVETEPDAHPFWFRHQDTEAALAAAAPDPFGLRRHILASQPHIPTMQLSFIGLDKGAGTGPQRSTASKIFAVTKGEGRFVSGDKDVSWARGDVFAAPIWTPFEISATADAQIFEVSDAPALKALGLYYDPESLR